MHSVLMGLEARIAAETRQMARLSSEGLYRSDVHPADLLRSDCRQTLTLDDPRWVLVSVQDSHDS